MKSSTRHLLLFALLSLFLAFGFSPSCSNRVFDASRATRAYPHDLTQGETIECEAYRDSAQLVIVNNTLNTFEGFDIWLNQQFVTHVDLLNPGQTIRLQITDFFDVWGETPVPGGFFRSRPPTRIGLVQFQLDQTSPLVGLLTTPLNNEL